MLVIMVRRREGMRGGRKEGRKGGREEGNKQVSK